MSSSGLNTRPNGKKKRVLLLVEPVPESARRRLCRRGTEYVLRERHADLVELPAVGFSLESVALNIAGVNHCPSFRDRI